MHLLFFWIKVAVKRILDLSKPFFLIIICSLLFIGAFIYAFINRYIVIKLELNIIYLIISLISLYSISNSFKNYNLMPVLIKYSKSKYQNKFIYLRYFLKQALINNLLLIIFNIIAFYSIINYSTNNINHIFILFGITILSIILSFIIICIKYIYSNKNSSKINNGKLKINPLIKSVLYDYLSSDFIITFVLCIILFIILIKNITGDTSHFNEMENESVIFYLITIIFSVGFSGIIGSTLNINWKFQAIISPNDIKYHLKRTFFVLFGFFGWLILLFIIFGSLINIMLLVKYLYCIFVILFTTINISFSITHVLLKTFMMTIIIILTIWVSTFPIYFLPILILPVIFTFIKAKNEYKEWFLI
jgi:hypothetical protein